MRRALTIVFRLGVAVGIFAVVRQILLDRTPRQSLSEQPVIGSLDTWPEVPRRQAG